MEQEEKGGEECMRHSMRPLFLMNSFLIEIFASRGNETLTDTDIP